MSLLISVVAYNRANSLSRLLQSLSYLVPISNPVDLAFSIDHSDSDEVLSVATNFKWDLGEKFIHFHKERLGLKRNVVYATSLVEKYDAVIVLEDDLYVSPQLLLFADCLLKNKFINDERIAGFGFYSHPYNEFANYPWKAIDDGFDNYYLKIPCSSGQMFTKKQWLTFLNYYNDFDASLFSSIDFPEIVHSWPNQSSWKKVFFSYLIAQNKYFFYSRHSYSTNMGEAGSHYTKSVDFLQSNLVWSQNEYVIPTNFSSIDNCLSIYDQYNELETLKFVGNVIAGVRWSEVEFDLLGLKSIHSITKKYLISSKISNNPILKFGINMTPFELNILHKNILFRNHNDLTNSTDNFTLALTKNFFEIPNTDFIQALSQRFDHDIRISINTDTSKITKSISYRLGRCLTWPFRKVHKLLLQQL